MENGDNRPGRSIPVPSTSIHERENVWSQVVRKMGPRYADASISKFQFYGSTEEQARQKEVIELVRDFGSAVVERTRTGRGVIFYGSSGTGKDMLQSALMRNACKLGLTVDWINGLDLFGEFRDRMESKGKSEEAKFRALAQPDILAISDPLPPYGQLTPFQTTVLSRLVDRRYRMLKPVWITVNVASRAEAERRMGHSTVDRISERALLVCTDWPSYRQFRA